MEPDAANMRQRLISLALLAILGLVVPGAAAAQVFRGDADIALAPFGGVIETG